jgi:glycosyltransferase involved in cell wall biosynthesis
MRILMITGSKPPEFCGIGDYADRLTRALNAAGTPTELFHTADWRPHRLPAIARAIAASRADLFHIQYPTLGYRRSMVPVLMPLFVRSAPWVVSLQEFSVYRKLRQVALLPFSLTDGMIFTNGVERERFKRAAPWMRSPDEVITIGSSIPAGTTRARDLRLVAYFGQVSPDKNLEAFLALARQARAAGAPFRFTLIGGIPAKFRDYAGPFLAQAHEAGIATELDLPAEAVADRLANVGTVYLPFPDGVSIKRSSLMAAMVNGTVVLAPYGAMTDDWLRGFVVEAPTPADALAALHRLDAAPADREAMRTRTLEAAREVDWGMVAQRHITLYRTLIAQYAERHHRVGGPKRA